ncbi:MAG: hypothetical protein LBV07_01955 [Syntrophobacterales bacterium]|jgi:hypothetical protein|nr:hypothetical protein [Syntrophobacterales bacterium]
MKKMLINDLEADMVLAKPILRGSMVILAEGTVLTDTWISRIEDMGIEYIFVEGTMEQAIPLDEALTLLDGRFRLVENEPSMGFLKKIVREHIESLYQHE